MVKILLAEDDKDLNALICARLTQEGYEAIPCADGQEAWETLENCAADLVITDIMMPRMDGFALAGRIRETDKKLPILFLTALDDKPSKQRGFALGIDDYVAKPFDTDLVVFVAAEVRVRGFEPHRKISRGDRVRRGKDGADGALYRYFPPYEIDSRADEGEYGDDGEHHARLRPGRHILRQRRIDEHRGGDDRRHRQKEDRRARP